VLVFRRRRADRIKTLVWDGSGLMLIWKGSIGRGFTCRGSRGRRRLGERRDKVNRG
jgi:transposase